MKQPDRKLLRAAQKVGEIYRRDTIEPCPSLPEWTCQEVARVERLWRRSQRGQWGSQQSLNRALRLRIDELRRALDDYAIGLARQSSDDQPSLRTLYDDLIALAHEFDEVQVDLHEKRLSVITSSIVLDSVELGRFEIRLHWPRLLSGKAYRVVALEPMPAATNNSVTHPHVQDNSLCEGEGQLAIRAALKQGRLLDFFLLVRQILETYNSGSAYVPLSDWFGVTCSDCGTTAGEEESCTCRRCGSDLCDDCSRSCNSCGQSSCSAAIASVLAATPITALAASRRAETAAKATAQTVSQAGSVQTAGKTRTTNLKRTKWSPRRPVRSMPRLRFTPYAWAKLVFLRDIGPTEVGAFGISAGDDLLLVEDIRLVHQVCTAVTVAFDDEAVADFFDEHVDRGLQPERFGRIWIHTHPGSSPEPSRTDEQTFDRSFAGPDWALMFILARGGRSYARLCFRTGPGGESVLPVQVDYQHSFAASNHEAWAAEYQRCVTALDEPLDGDPQLSREYHEFDYLFPRLGGLWS